MHRLQPRQKPGLQHLRLVWQNTSFGDTHKAAGRSSGSFLAGDKGCLVTKGRSCLLECSKPAVKTQAAWWKPVSHALIWAGASHHTCCTHLREGSLGPSTVGEGQGRSGQPRGADCQAALQAA